MRKNSEKISYISGNGTLKLKIKKFFEFFDSLERTGYLLTKLSCAF